MTNHKAVVFDVDGVLLDLWNAEKEFFDRFIPDDLKGQDVYQLETNHTFSTRVMDEIRHYEGFAQIPPVQGMPALLPDLKSAGYDLFVLTAAPPEEDFMEKRKRNLMHVYGDVFNDIRFSGAIPKGEILANYANTYAFTAFVDDSPRQIRSAMDAVSMPIWVDTPFYASGKSILDFSKIKSVQTADDLRRLLIK